MTSSSVWNFPSFQLLTGFWVKCCVKVSKPFLTAVSISSGVPMPCSRTRIAPRRYGTMSRFTMNPATSLATTGVFPSFTTNALDCLELTARTSSDAHGGSESRNTAGAGAAASGMVA